MREGKIFPCGVIAQITAHIGGNTHQVVGRRTFEAQRRRGLVTVQNDIAVLVAEVEIDIPDGRFICRTGYSHHSVGLHLQYEGNRVA